MKYTKLQAIEKLYGIFAEQDSNSSDLVLTYIGADKLLNKINELVDAVNDLRNEEVKK